MSSSPLAVSLAGNALTTLEDMKVLLGIDPSDIEPMRDAILTHTINAVSAWVERTLGRKLRLQTYTHRFNATGGQYLTLEQWPVVKVYRVKDTDSGYIIPPASYDFGQTGEIGQLYRDEGWPLAGYRAGLAYDTVAPKRCIEAKYAAGYVLPKDADPPRRPCTLPADILSVVWQAVEQEYTLRCSGAAGLAAFSIADISWTFDKSPNPTWLATLARYTRI